MTVSMAQKLEVVHVKFLQQVTGQKIRRIGDDSWRRVAAESVLQAVGTKPPKTYIDKRHATVAECVALQPIFEVCTKGNGYEGGELGEPWWRQAAAEQQLKTTLKEILAAAWEGKK